VLLLPETHLQKIFPDNFVLNKPKDIVSGDFYWCNVFENYKIVLVADCTGHGVPAAFMSIISVLFLREITENKCFMPDEILNNLREKIMISMQQNEGMDSESTDSMDAAVVTVDLKEKIIYYSGANNDIYVINNGELTIHEADLMSVGVSIRNVPFSLKTIKIMDNCNVYMLSDGYVDQFNKKNKKITTVGLKKCLKKIHSYPMQKQAQFLEKYLNMWKQDARQTDDILVVGFNVNS
jgi:serine phosphatase RsbU (regulator of sigma subunit)